MDEGAGGRGEVWDSARVRALRCYLRLTQRQLAQEMGARQQTVSEWETGAYRPRGVSRRLLSLIAERAGFRYGPSPGSGQGEGER